MTTNGLQQNLRELRRARDKAARYNSHVNFLTTCLQQKLIPKGMRAKFGHDALPKNDFLQKHVRDSLHSASLDIVSQCKETYSVLLKKEEAEIHASLYALFQCTTYSAFENILQHHHRAYNRLRDKLRKKKNRKLKSLTSTPVGQTRPESTTLQQNQHQAHPTPAEKKTRNRRFKRRGTDNTTKPSEMAVVKDIVPRVTEREKHSIARTMPASSMMDGV
ncbi:hypothetical protein ACOMHN_036845 [Nucella lapillus]